ncbi:MAG: biotin--[acetyl-CoA-carboxylase] ligase [Candidatus Omnitrophota bacterium]|nr:MAG: biotin--[acetyl-CoA-carboxylase] ligase [Candidatus Omnitrophota bacterium]
MERRLKIIKLDTVDSTNKYAWRLAEKGERELTVVTARAQNKGYGRRGRPWQSPKDKGVYVSFVLRPQNSLEQICLLPLIFSLGVVRIFKDVLPLKIKWPNDVIAGDKKIAGCLVEACSRNNKVDFVIAGIGINIGTLQQDLPALATSVYLETAKSYPIDEVLKKLIKEVITLYEQFKTADIKPLLDEIYLYQKEKFNLKDKDLTEAIEVTA